jgi:N-acylglucosamine 2-epimerase
MNRRNFILSIPSVAALSTFKCSNGEKQKMDNNPAFIKGLTLKQHRDELQGRLFNEYLPFWENGGYDKQYGGFICNLDDKGIPVDDEKFIWYQGRAIWVYSFLFNNFGRDSKYFEIAKHTRNFMVKYMYIGNGQWAEKVHRSGDVIKGVGPDSDIYGWLFAANGLAEYYKISGNAEDLQLIKESLISAQETYDSPNYREGTDFKGLRIQGHSMLFVRLLTQLLSFYHDVELEKLRDFHLDKLITRFFNPVYKISNEELLHDYNRIDGKEGIMFLGHSLEGQWMVLQTALQKNDKRLFESAKNNFRRYLEMGWDYNFDGWGSEDYYVFAGPDHIQGTDFSTKTMWAHTEILIGCMIVIEHTDESWAKDWYERTWEYIKKTFCRGIGAWEQAVNRYGEPKSREKWGIHPMRRGNYHQPRFLMMNILSLDRMIKKINNM